MRTLPIQLVLALFLVAPAASAQLDLNDRADDPWYLQLALGGVWPNDADAPNGSIEFDRGYSAALALGYYLGEMSDIDVCAEVEAITTSFKIREGELANFNTDDEAAGATAFMINVVGDIDVSDNVSFYAGGGGGYATRIEFDTLDSGSGRQLDDDGFAAQVKLGFRYSMGELFDVALGYRFFKTEDVSVLNGPVGAEADFENNIFELTMRWAVL